MTTDIQRLLGAGNERHRRALDCPARVLAHLERHGPELGRVLGAPAARPVRPYIKQLPQRVWRGRKVTDGLKHTVQQCHTRSLVRCVIRNRKDGRFPRPPRIRSGFSTSECSATYSAEGTWRRTEGRGFEIAHYIWENHDTETQKDQRRLALQMAISLSVAPSPAYSSEPRRNGRGALDCARLLRGVAR